MKTEIGLLGFGRFGRMAYHHLCRGKQLRVYDTDSRKLADIPEAASFEGTVRSGLVLLCVPISAIEDTCKKMAPLLREGQIVVDTCSVKQYPVSLMLAHLPPFVEILGTHPLFGPDSGQEGIAGLKIGVCRIRISDESYQMIRRYLESLHLVIIETDPEEHDRQIAKSQAIFHLLAQAMKRLGWDGQAISTPGPENFFRLVRMVQHDTEQLFLDMERENPYAAQYRQEFIRQLLELDRELTPAQE
ncbi:MAG: prephenate dehydrogenase/arogenate dehydrogenase family protein [Acidobacteriota bacterium]